MESDENSHEFFSSLTTQLLVYFTTNLFSFYTHAVCRPQSPLLSSLNCDHCLIPLSELRIYLYVGSFASISRKRNRHFQNPLFLIHCLPNFRSTFAPYLNDQTEDIFGVNTSQLIVGSAQSHTGIHVENLNLPSCNYLHDGEDKFWIV